ncbi:MULTISPECIES: sirohydrochlorin chelatase [Streptomyces]|uniref:CbiX/SirB N-terminal domain-containing protein n=1 Tax=Streptomyces pratisoli TaxID=3139917 RepID=A0ACC6QD64_9ACTN|nr:MULTISPECIES: CbiX/SirB N-terminal domain-containing protein [unclassified Streptomyces]
MTSPPALLIAADGARHEAGAAALLDFVEHLGSRHPGIPVTAGLVGAERWPLGEAVDELVAAGAERLAAVSLALVPDRRADDGLSAALTAACASHPGLSVTRSRVLGPDPALLALLERRLDEALGGAARTPRDRADVTVLLVAPGSADPEANAQVHRAARLLWEGRGYAGVETAFVSTAAPDVPAGLDRCVRLGARRIVVLPYVLFDGGPVERARLHAEGWAEAHPDTQVRYAEPIGAGEELADLVVERYREAVAGCEPPQPRDLQDEHELAG